MRLVRRVEPPRVPPRALRMPLLPQRVPLPAVRCAEHSPLRPIVRRRPVSLACVPHAMPQRWKHVPVCAPPRPVPPLVPARLVVPSAAKS